MIGQLFDPNAELNISEHYRPHWSQAGAIVFVTFRTHDSIPREVIRHWDRQKHEWLRQRGILTEEHWSIAIQTLSVKDKSDFMKSFSRVREAFLDTCSGRCLLKRPELARIVVDSLLHFDGERYRMGDFVVMPNHVHLLAAFPSSESLSEQCDSWLHDTGFQINRALREKGKFWQQEPFDHLVRSPEQYEYLRKYIADNPQKAGLRDGEYFLRRLDC